MDAMGPLFYQGLRNPHTNIPSNHPNTLGLCLVPETVQSSRSWAAPDYGPASIGQKGFDKALLRKTNGQYALIIRSAISGGST